MESELLKQKYIAAREERIEAWMHYQRVKSRGTGSDMRRAIDRVCEADARYSEIWLEMAEAQK